MVPARGACVSFGLTAYCTAPGPVLLTPATVDSHGEVDSDCQAHVGSDGVTTNTDVPPAEGAVCGEGVSA
jgi:hypothetical protein